MVRFSVRTDYAIRALLEVAARDPELVKVSDIVALQHLPPDYLASLLGRLAHAGLVVSRRGPNGGFVLADSPDSITLYDIVDAIDRPSRDLAAAPVVPAAGSLAAMHLSALWEALSSHTRLVLEGITLRQILDGDFEIDGQRPPAAPLRRRSASSGPS